MANRISVLILILVLTWGCGQKEEAKVVIAASSNTRFALEEIAQRYESRYGVHCELITASSGKLYAQIENGAPYDLFLSADKMYPEKLAEADLTLDQPKTYAQGILALWTLDSNLTLEGNWWENPALEHLAMANPEIAPYGRAAAQVLERLDPKGQTTSKQVFGENVAQAAQFVTSGHAQMGLLAQSLVIDQSGRRLVLADSLYDPILQSVVVMKNHPGNSEDVSKFYNFLFSEEIQLVLIKHGYSIPH